jgi:transposase
MSSKRRYKWRYVFGFVHPESGRTEWFISSTVSVDGMNVVLAGFAAAVGACATKRVVIAMDGAGWHTGKGLELPEGIHIVRQPAYSPELQPAEQLWPLLHEPLANRDYVDLDELAIVAGARCRELIAATALLRSRTRFHWWPADRSPTADRAVYYRSVSGCQAHRSQAAPR